MMIVIGGTMRLPPENLDQIRPHMATVIAANRAEAGCIEFSLAEDCLEPGLIRVFEIWADQPALDAHRKTQHLATWREVGATLGVGDRKLFVHEVASRTAL
ncbi:MAG: antibiotic biosynthesis monooxygenase [Caulobacteraceae bacterium]|nr:antibiotic biosynthesis monooxygenase [Caulobacteraceae bacterium]